MLHFTDAPCHNQNNIKFHDFNDNHENHETSKNYLDIFRMFKKLGIDYYFFEINNTYDFGCLENAIISKFEQYMPTREQFIDITIQIKELEN